MVEQAIEDARVNAQINGTIIIIMTVNMDLATLTWPPLYRCNQR